MRTQSALFFERDNELRREGGKKMKIPSLNSARPGLQSWAAEAFETGVLVKLGATGLHSRHYHCRLMTLHSSPPLSSWADVVWLDGI